jgi:hypothetical protein
VYPFARRTLLCAEPPEKTGTAELASLGWEIANAESISHRTFHYDAVIWRGSESKTVFGRSIEETQGPVVSILDPDGSPEAEWEVALVHALAAAGIPRQDGATRSFSSSAGPIEPLPRARIH